MYQHSGGEVLVGIKYLDTTRKPFAMLSYEELLERIKDNDKNALEFLINRYRGVILAKTNHYCVAGGDREDVIQEGLIGLYKAIRDYESDRPSSFRAFAELCIMRNIITAIKSASRQKHIPLNSSLSLDKPIYQEESERTLLDIIEGANNMNPEELLVNRERLEQISIKLSTMLTDLERKVLKLYLEGCSYKEISEEIDRHVKSIANALQRVKKKLESLAKLKELSF